MALYLGSKKYKITEKSYPATVRSKIDVFPSPLPDAYQEISHIESTGAQYINTEVLASEYPDGINYYYKGYVTYDEADGGSSFLWGALKDSKQSGSLAVNEGEIALVVGGKNTQSRAVLTDPNQCLTISAFAKASAPEAKDTKLQINGTESVPRSGAVASDMPDADIWFLKLNGGTRPPAKTKTGKFRMTDVNEKIIKNFVPCYQKNSLMVGLYDTVDGKFHTSETVVPFHSNEVPIVLPAEYERLEYIESTGTQYIDTGILATNYPDGLGYVFEGIVLSTNANEEWLWGALKDGKRSGNLEISKNYGFFGLAVGGTSAMAVSGSKNSIVFDEHITVSAFAAASAPEKSTMGVNNTIYDSISANTPSDMPSANIYLGQCSGSSRVPAKLKISTFRMLDANKNTIRFLIAARRKADNVAGLYDTVGKKFYTNAGTGDFQKGV